MARHPDWVTEFLSEADLESLASAVRQAEAKTSAEIRVHLDHTCNEDALPRAIRIFERLGMHRTAQRNGVLIYISVQDHKLAVIGDTGIHERVGEAYWRGLVDAVRERMRAAALARGAHPRHHRAGEHIGPPLPAPARRPERAVRRCEPRPVSRRLGDTPRRAAVAPSPRAGRAGPRDSAHRLHRPPLRRPRRAYRFQGLEHGRRARTARASPVSCTPIRIRRAPASRSRTSPIASRSSGHRGRSRWPSDPMRASTRRPVFPARAAHRLRHRVADPRRRVRAMRDVAVGRARRRRLGLVGGPGRCQGTAEHARPRADHPRRRRVSRAPAMVSRVARGRSGREDAARGPRRAERGRAPSLTRRRRPSLGGAERRAGADPHRRAPRSRATRALERQDRGPLILGVAARAPETLALDPLLPPAGLVAGWDFSRGIEGLDVVDIGPHRLGGRLVNLPTRAVTGARWSGSEMCWRHAPREYAAIHFHDDDIYDAGWATDFEFTVPDDMPSGAYLMRLAADGHVEELPFYVRPSRGRREADVLFIASTYTYQAYANHARGNSRRGVSRAAWRRGAPIRTIRTIIPSTAAPPTTGIATAAASATPRACVPCSRLRPRYLTFLDARGSGLRHYPADTHLLDWLEAQGIAFDVVTDEDVDAEGAALLAPYASRAHRLASRVPHRAHATTRTRAISRAAGGSSIWAATASTGASRPARSCPASSRSAAPRGGIRAWEARGRRVLPRPRRRVRRPVAAQRATAPAARRRGFLRAGALRGLVLPTPARGRRSARGVDTRRGRRRR